MTTAADFNEQQLDRCSSATENQTSEPEFKAIGGRYQSSGLQVYQNDGRLQRIAVQVKDRAKIFCQLQLKCEGEISATDKFSKP